MSKAQAFNTLNKFATARVQLIQGMKDAGYTTLEECRPIVIEWACSKTGASFKVSGTGKVMLDSKHAKYETTKTVVRDVMHMLQGTTRREEIGRAHV